MGRLDDAAKHKVVELRKAGLSFRKIKAVLELENIKVSAQAIYLYLREFQGRPPGRVRPLEAGDSTLAQTAQAQAGALQERWSNIHLQNLMRDGPHRTEYPAPSNFSKQASTNSETTSNSSGSGEASGSSRPEQQSGGNKEENDIQIVSVTSLAQHGQQRVTQPPVRRPETSSNMSSTLMASGAFLRRRVTPSPATSSILAARKRLLDRALSHRTKSFHQMATLLRRDQAGVQSSDLSSALPQQPETYDLTTEKTVMEGQPGHNSSPRRFAAQRPGMSVRSLHPPPRVGIHLPNRPPVPLTSSSPGTVLRLPSPRTQGSSEGNSNPPSAVQDTRARGSLQDQIQTLGSEVRSLGLAVKMMVEQQCRLEREQSLQTQIQKQILSTLQTLSSKAGLCSRTPQRLNKTPSPSSLPATSATTSFGQETYTFSQGTFSQCGQTQPGYNSLERLESAEAFKVPGMSPPSINGFPPCSNADSLPLTHTSSQSQTYPAAYQQQNSQALLAPYTQSYVSLYDHTHTQSFRTPESKTADFSARTFTDCSGSTQQVMNSSSHNQPLSSIKVEGP
ncbi:uncharacterized protein LOC111611636 [Xiphophorus maculatus]|uniref:uncharacterized protein LOC111611636 n=1 Tax=Xiphophorus maculatus TaxID=8083 RepID=UPI000C6E5CB6|nr:uncharacterized protein LOC111611636 [Xiphophorus maculatus]